jgi:BirA family biotin operon repressor/biotin-[acetyl-CoA-carboxylase] ligase
MFLTEKKIVAINEVDSTNNYAKQLIADKAQDGTVVLAHYQNSGKGQQGNFWESEAQKNLLFSLILYPGFLDAAKQFYISKAVSLALVEVLKNEKDNVAIKWPNDIYVGKKKIAGILIENSIKGVTLDSTIIGVGLNLNQEIFVSDAPNPISLKQLTGKDYHIESILNEFLTHFYRLFDKLKLECFNEIDKLYMDNLFRKKEWYLFREKGIEFEARISGIGDFGQLQLENKSGEILEFMFKEVEFVI